MRIDNAVGAAKAYTDTKPANAKADHVKDVEVKTIPKTDTATFSKTAEEVKAEAEKNTAKSKADTIAQLVADSERRTAQFQEMLKSMFVKQGEKHNLVLMGQKLNVTLADSQKAQASIAPGGEYSVDAVAGRIMDMAKALSGGDASKIEILKDAVKKGFGAAGVELGQELPQISKDTYDEIMKRFDDWENGTETKTE